VHDGLAILLCLTDDEKAELATTAATVNTCAADGYDRPMVHRLHGRCMLRHKGNDVKLGTQATRIELYYTL